MMMMNSMQYCNEIAYITGQLYNRKALENIHYFGDSFGDWAAIRNIKSKANRGGFLHIEIGEQDKGSSADGSRGSPDHQALLLQYVLRYFTNSSFG